MELAYYSQYVLNEEGQPVSGAMITVKKTSDDSDVILYTPSVSADFVLSNNTGKFEFWIANIQDTERIGYKPSELFDIYVEVNGITTTINNVIMAFPAPVTLYTGTLGLTWTPAPSGQYTNTCVHNLGTLYPFVNIYKESPVRQVMPSQYWVYASDENTLTVYMVSDPTTEGDTYRIVVLGRNDSAV